MELDTELITTVKVVHEKVSQIRWTIEDFSEALFANDEDPLESNSIPLNDESETKACFWLYCPWGVGTHLFSLNFWCYGFGGRGKLEVRCKCWIENSNGDKYGETEERQHTFYQDANNNDFIFNDFLDRRNLFKNFVFSGGRAIICAEVSYRVTEEKYKEPKADMELRQNLWTAYQQGLTDDFIIQIKGKQLNVSKNIFAANSDVFEQMLMVETCREEQKNVVEIKETSYEIMEAFIEYLHRGQVNSLSQICDELFALSHKYNVAQLKTDCIEEMSRSLNKENVIERLKLAFLHNEEKLKKSALDYVTSPSSDLNFRQILNSDKWTELEISNKALKNEITDAVFDKMNFFRKQSNDTPVMT